MFDEMALLQQHFAEERAKAFGEKNIPSFLRESNRIEGEVTSTGKGKIYPSDKKAIKWLQNNKLETVEDLCTLHGVVGSRIKEEWVGRLRNVDVSIQKIDLYGKRTYTKTIEKGLLGHYIDAYMQSLPYMNAWEAHTYFELIHPFNDLNGRVGRLIWLYKRDMMAPRIGFLHKYYYETLDNVRVKRSKKINRLLLDLTNNLSK